MFPFMFSVGSMIGHRTYLTYCDRLIVSVVENESKGNLRLNC
jgi:hypothetical protein